MIWLLLIVPGLLAAYILLLRPLLHAIPAFQQFYEESDGFWEKVWALCGNSATMAFAYFVQAVGWVLQLMEPVATFFGDPDLKQQITTMLQMNPKILSYVLMGISFCTIAARVRSLMPRDE